MVVLVTASPRPLLAFFSSPTLRLFDDDDDSSWTLPVHGKSRDASDCSNLGVFVMAGDDDLGLGGFSSLCFGCAPTSTGTGSFGLWGGSDGEGSQQGDGVEAAGGSKE